MNRTSTERHLLPVVPVGQLPNSPVMTSTAFRMIGGRYGDSGRYAIRYRLQSARLGIKRQWFFRTPASASSI